MNNCARRMLCAFRLCLLLASLRLVPAPFGAESRSEHPLKGSYLCVETPETPNQWAGSGTLEIQEEGVMTYFMFPTAVVVRHGQPHPMFATGSGSWQRLDGEDGDYSLAIITGTEMSIARRRNREGEDLLEIEHPSTAGRFITRWKRTGDASEPFPRGKVSQEQKQRSATDVASNALEELRQLRGQVQVGYAAFCRYERKIHELQVIGEVRTLDEEERKVLSDLLTAEGTWYLRTPDQNLSGGRSFSMDPDDFKFVLVGKEMVFMLRVASGSRQVQAMLNGKPVALPNIRSFAFEMLRTYFDRWFPGWENVTRKNYSEWLSEIHRRGHGEAPNKSVQPTPGSVMPRASAGTSK
jgi:hypothetical protein